MLWCPRCRTEYRDGYERCSDCGALLEPRPPTEPARREPMTPKLLATIADPVRLGQACAYLRAQGVTVLEKSRDFGGVSRIAAGRSICGTELYVDEREYGRAKALFDDLPDPDADAWEPGGACPDNRRGRARRWIMRLVALWVVAGLLFGAVQGLRPLLRLLAGP